MLLLKMASDGSSVNVSTTGVGMRGRASAHACASRGPFKIALKHAISVSRHGSASVALPFTGGTGRSRAPKFSAMVHPLKTRSTSTASDSISRIRTASAL